MEPIHHGTGTILGLETGTNHYFFRQYTERFCDMG